MSDITSLVIRGATRLEPGQPRREVDIVIDDGVITELNILHWGSRRAELGSVHDPHHTKKRKVVIEATGMYVGPGFLDLHAHLREPGQTKKETIATGAAAAAAAGVSSRGREGEERQRSRPGPGGGGRAGGGGAGPRQPGPRPGRGELSRRPGQ